MLKRTGLFVLAAAMSVCSARFIMAGDASADSKEGTASKAPASKPADETEEPRTLTGYYLRVAKDVKLTPEQLVEFQKKVRELADKAKEWDQTNGAKIAELKKSFEEATKAGKKENVESIKTEMQKMLAEKEKALDALRETVMAVLTDAQKEMVKEFNFYYGILGRFKAAKVTGEQKDKIKALCAEAFQKALAAKTDVELDDVKKTLVDKITNEVLTDEQKKILKDVKAGKAGEKDDDGQDSEMSAPAK